MSQFQLHITGLALRHPNNLIIKCIPAVPGYWPRHAVFLDLAIYLANHDQPIILRGELPLLTDDATDFSLKLSIPEVLQAPLRQIKFINASDAGIKIPSELIAALDNLYPNTDAEYERTYLSRKDRFGDSQTQFFLAHQICLYYQGNVAYKVSSAVVAGYKAAESGQPSEAALAKLHLENAQHWLTGLPFHKHPRRNPEHLRHALLTALWHMHLAMGDRRSCLDALERSYRHALSLRYYTTAAYPICRSLLLLGWIQFKRHNPDTAMRRWTRATEVFALGVKDSSFKNPVLFEELRDAHASAVMAARGMGMVAKHALAAQNLSTAEVLARAARVSGEPAQRMLKHLTQWVGA